MRKKILIIDDEKDLVETIGLRLKAKDYDTIEAYNGPDGLKLALSDNPDLVVLDIMMPGMDGIEVLRRLRLNPKTKTLPVIILSAKCDTNSIIKTQETGSTDYLIKPFESKELLELIDKYT